jgi:hypothetical protein
VTELANASVICSRDLGSNLRVDIIISDLVCIGFEFKFVGH